MSGKRKRVATKKDAEPVKKAKVEKSESPTVSDRIKSIWENILEVFPGLKEKYSPMTDAQLKKIETKAIAVLTKDFAFKNAKKDFKMPDDLRAFFKLLGTKKQNGSDEEEPSSASQEEDGGDGDDSEQEIIKDAKEALFEELLKTADESVEFINVAFNDFDQEAENPPVDPYWLTVHLWGEYKVFVCNCNKNSANYGEVKSFYMNEGDVYAKPAFKSFLELLDDLRRYIRDPIGCSGFDGSNIYSSSVESFDLSDWQLLKAAQGEDLVEKISKMKKKKGKKPTYYYSITKLALREENDDDDDEESAASDEEDNAVTLSKCEWDFTTKVLELSFENDVEIKIPIAETQSILIRNAITNLGCFIPLNQLRDVIGNDKHVDFYLEDLKAADFLVPETIFANIKKKNANVLAKRALVKST
jgi:predicted HicB family RNase H-like nuclease